MTTIESQAQQYLFNLNSITRKIHQDIKILHKNQNEVWEDLEFERQEALLDDFFVDQAVREKYSVDSTDGADQPVVFPKYTVNCGEKIIIDFDNDGWTWRDEHSAPFSWMSRSQQDLSILEDEEDEGIEKDKVEQKRKRIQKSRSPERPDHGSGDLAFKPEKSIWESPFLAADRGLDSAYPSSHASEQSRTSDESDDLSQKLAASLSVSIDEDVVDSQLNSPGTHADTSILLDSGHQKMIDVSSARLDLSRKGSGSCSSSEDTCSLTSRGSGSSRSRSGSGNRKKDSGSLVNKKLWNPLKKDKKKEVELNLITEPHTGKDSGQVSPVYLEEPGESSSDFAPTSASTTQSSTTTFTFSSSAREELAADEDDHKPADTAAAPAAQATGVTGQVNEGLNDSFQNSEGDEWNSELFSNTTTTDDGDLKKSGFDFLDNW